MSIKKTQIATFHVRHNTASTSKHHEKCVRKKINSPQTSAASLYHDTTNNTENKTQRMQFHDNLLEEYA
jgi:hypothetical protein